MIIDKPLVFAKKLREKGELLYQKTIKKYKWRTLKNCFKNIHAILLFALKTLTIGIGCQNYARNQKFRLNLHTQHIQKKKNAWQK